MNRVTNAKTSLIEYLIIFLLVKNPKKLFKSFWATKSIVFSKVFPLYISSVPTLSPFFIGKL